MGRLKESLFSKLEVKKDLNKQLKEDKEDIKDWLFKFDFIWYLISNGLAMYVLLNAEIFSDFSFIFPILTFIVPIIVNGLVKAMFYKKVSKNVKQCFFTKMLKLMSVFLFLGLTMSVLLLFMFAKNVQPPNSILTKIYFVLYNVVFYLLGSADKWIWYCMDFKEIIPNKEKEVTA